MRNSFRTHCPIIFKYQNSHTGMSTNPASCLVSTSSLTRAQAPRRSRSMIIIHEKAMTKGVSDTGERKVSWGTVVSAFTVGFSQLPTITQTSGTGSGLSPRPTIMTLQSASHQKKRKCHPAKWAPRGQENRVKTIA